MNPDALLERVRKLLAMAEADVLEEPARQAYNAKAAELIAQYGIDRALVEAAAPHDTAPADLVIGIDPPYARDKISLLASVADPLGCRLVHRTRPGAIGVNHAAHLFGMGSDISRVQMLFTSLLVQQSHGMARIRPPAWEDPRAFRRSWMAGFAVAVRDRLVDAERAARAAAESGVRVGGPEGAGRLGGRSVELVLADRAGRVDTHLDSVYPRLRSTRARQLSGSGGRDGYQAGRRADIGAGRRVRSGSSRRQLG